MNYYNEIKEILINNEITKRAKDYSKNKSDLESYFEVGKMIVEAQGGEERAKYGDGLIKEYSRKLMIELDKKYSCRNLMFMRKFYIIFSNPNVNALRSKLTWTHYRTLLKLDNIYEIKYYINICVNQSLSYRQLDFRIKNKEYERLDEQTKIRLINQEENQVIDFVKNPILISNNKKYSNISEKILKKLILEDIDNFLLELGNGFCYIKNEYKIKIGNTYNYLDFLLFNIEYNCYVVLELKMTELKKEHIGQIQVYMNYIDNNIKKLTHNKTIGIIIVKKDNKLILEYSSDKRIYSTSYITN